MEYLQRTCWCKISWEKKFEVFSNLLYVTVKTFCSKLDKKIWLDMMWLPDLCSESILILVISCLGGRFGINCPIAWNFSKMSVMGVWEIFARNEGGAKNGRVGKFLRSL